VDGNELLDYVGTWGPAILGHAHPRIISAIKTAAERGTSFGIPNPLEVTMAKLICERVPSVQKVRMTNSGTEACMSAIRLARGFTKRDKIIKFDGCYHGHVDSLLVRAGSGALTFGHPDSAGIPAAFIQHTVVLPFNDVDAVKAAFAANQGQIAGIILEAIPANAGLYLPRPGYLEFLRKITLEQGALLIFDEVMTGFRSARGGAQERFGVTPDLSCFGKIIGGGLPVGAFGGRSEIMDYLSPLGPVYQAGTLSGNPLAMAAGIATLSYLQENAAEVYRRLEETAKTVAEGVMAEAAQAGVPLTLNRVGSMWTWFFTASPVTNYEQAALSDTAAFGRFHNAMLNQGIWLPPSQFEAMFLGAMHGEAEVTATLAAARKAFQFMQELAAQG